MSSITRSQFDALDHVAKMSHIRSGAAIVSDPQIVGRYDHLPFQIDAQKRLDQMKAYDAQAQAIADESAKLDSELAKAKAILARWQAEG